MPFEQTDPEPIKQPDAPDASTVTDLIEHPEDLDPADPDPEQPDAEQPDQDPRLRKARDESAGYRRRLREAEADRDAARALLAAARGQIAEAAHEVSYIGQFIP